MFVSALEVWFKVCEDAYFLLKREVVNRALSILKFLRHLPKHAETTKGSQLRVNLGLPVYIYFVQINYRTRKQ